jgi:hypothetical protein
MQRSLGARAGRRQGRVGLGLTKKVIPHRSTYSLFGQIRLGLLQILHTHAAFQECIARGAARRQSRSRRSSGPRREAFIRNSR